jgi:hypothetical protein
LEWLKEYAGTDPPQKPRPLLEPERNQGIAAEELPELFELLRVPSDEERQRLSASALSLAQEAYARREFTLAYRHVQFAISAQPDNEKALADLSLMAMKAGDPHRALATAKQLIDTTPSVVLRASAWFNLGLLCEQDSIRETLFYRGASCDRDWLRPFMQAWKLQPTAGRANKLRQLFDKQGVGACPSAGSKADKNAWLVRPGYGSEQVDRIYILHPGVDALEIAPSTDAPKVIDRLQLGDQAVTVLERRPTSAMPNINGQTCRMSLSQR